MKLNRDDSILPYAMKTKTPQIEDRINKLLVKLLL